MAVHRSTQALLLKCISSVNAKSVHISGILEQQLDGERRISEILTSKLSPLKLTVQDISGKVCNHNLVLLCWICYIYNHAGGCGSMYQIDIVSDKFRGKRTVQQHQMVNDVSL